MPSNQNAGVCFKICLPKSSGGWREYNYPNLEKKKSIKNTSIYSYTLWHKLCVPCVLFHPIHSATLSRRCRYQHHFSAGKGEEQHRHLTLELLVHTFSTQQCTKTCLKRLYKDQGTSAFDARSKVNKGRNKKIPQVSRDVSQLWRLLVTLKAAT